MWDLFISHASEDKPFVRELAWALEAQGLKVWFDETTLKLGDSLRRSIDQGLGESRYGVVIISPAFFQKSWTQYELDGLVTLQMAYGKRILPVWHLISQREVMVHSPSLAGLMAVSTDRGITAVIQAIIDVVNPGQKVFPTPIYKIAEEKTATFRGSPSEKTRLLQGLISYFNLSELQTLCFELGIDFDDLGGEGKMNKARELISYLDRHGRLPELVQILRQQRPQMAW